MNCVRRSISRCRHQPLLSIVRSSSNCHYFSAVCLQRRPKVLRPMSVVEKTMSQLLAKREVALSLYSDHELRHFEDLRRAERLASKAEVDEKDMENATKQTAIDFEDVSNQEFASVSLAPDETQDDRDKKQKSLNRCLDRHLMLVTKVQLGTEWKWLLPFARNMETESLRQTAERALASTLGNESGLKTKILGNCPSAVYSYQFTDPAAASTASKSRSTARIFFFKAHVLSGDVKSLGTEQQTVRDFVWLDRSEAAHLFADQKTAKYWRSIRSALFQEQVPDRIIRRIISRVSESAHTNDRQTVAKGNRGTISA